MNRVFPIEQLAKHAVHHFQLAFATEAAGLLTSFRSLEPHPSRKGLLMLADHEDRLEQATEVLRDYYGADLRTHEPRVRHIGTNEIQEPIMKLSVRAPLEYMAAVQRDLKMRDADILVVDTGPFHCEIEARAPLATLLGYGKTLTLLTGGAGRHRMILSHYAPVPPDPEGFAA